jgi:GrpB-like predicted nucleotidyltransferase (UPF0157 family)
MTEQARGKYFIFSWIKIFEAQLVKQKYHKIHRWYFVFVVLHLQKSYFHKWLLYQSLLWREWWVWEMIKSYKLKKTMLIQEYNPEWIIQFEKIQAKLSDALKNINVNIEHIGSTSVPNLAAKPIIDVDIIYYQTADFQVIKWFLESLGYYHNGNQDVEDREVFKRNGVGEDEILDKITHHLYVCKYDCWELQRHISFRDYLRKHEIARNFYQNLKYKIAEEVNHDKKSYANMKEMKTNSFIDYVIELSKINKE